MAPKSDGLVVADWNTAVFGTEGLSVLNDSPHHYHLDIRKAYFTLLLSDLGTEE